MNTGFVLILTASKSGEFPRPKYWTGEMLEHWPVYVADPAKAHRFEDKKSAREVLAGFRARGFEGKVVAGAQP